MGKSSQRKGAEGERELAALLRDYGFDTQRGGSLSFGEVPDLTGLPGVHAAEDADVTLRLEDFMKLYQKGGGTNGGEEQVSGARAVHRA